MRSADAYNKNFNYTNDLPTFVKEVSMTIKSFIIRYISFLKVAIVNPS